MTDIPGAHNRLWHPALAKRDAEAEKVKPKAEDRSDRDKMSNFLDELDDLADRSRLPPAMIAGILELYKARYLFKEDEE